MIERFALSDISKNDLFSYHSTNPGISVRICTDSQRVLNMGTRRFGCNDGKSPRWKCQTLFEVSVDAFSIIFLSTLLSFQKIPNFLSVTISLLVIFRIQTKTSENSFPNTKRTTNPSTRKQFCIKCILKVLLICKPSKIFILNL